MNCPECKRLKEENERLLQRIRGMLKPRDYGLDQRAKEELADFYGPDFAASQLRMKR